MGHSQLDEFFRQKKERSEPSDVDWVAKRDQWLESIRSLFDTIERGYLATAKASVKIDRAKRKRVVEPYIREYEVEEMTLAVGDELVEFSPKGVNVVGATGRVDVRGDRGEATLVRQPPDRWMLVTSRTPTLRLVPLNEETFLEMLRSVMR